MNPLINSDDITAANYRDDEPKFASTPSAVVAAPAARQRANNPGAYPVDPSANAGSIFDKGGVVGMITSRLSGGENGPDPTTVGPPAPTATRAAAQPNFGVDTRNEQPGANSGMSNMTASAAAAPRKTPELSNANIPADQMNTVQLGDPMGDARTASRVAQEQQAMIDRARNSNALSAAQNASGSEDIAKAAYDRASISNPKGRREALATYLAARAANAQAGQALNTAGTPIANAVASTGIVNSARELALKGAQGAQGLREGAQKIQIGAADVKNRELLQKSVDMLHNAKTPEEQNSARQNLLIMQGKNPAEWKAVPVGGKIVTAADGTTSTVGGYAVLVNAITGEHLEVGKPKDQEASAGGYGEHPEGSSVTDKAGNVYTITKGQPVLTKKAS